LAEDSADQVLVGEAPSIQRVRQTIAILGRSDIDILVEGKRDRQGTGRRLIHRAGDRARKPFVTIACPAVPDALIDTLLTGDAARRAS
jgi:two-component system C4-dicarboxylate transport response regulator DctD